MRKKESGNECGVAAGYPRKGDRMQPFKRYTSIRKFKKAFPQNYSKHGWSVKDEIGYQRRMNIEMEECRFSYREMYARECAAVL